MIVHINIIQYVVLLSSMYVYMVNCLKISVPRHVPPLPSLFLESCMAYLLRSPSAPPSAPARLPGLWPCSCWQPLTSGPTRFASAPRSRPVPSMQKALAAVFNGSSCLFHVFFSVFQGEMRCLSLFSCHFGGFFERISRAEEAFLEQK